MLWILSPNVTVADIEFDIPIEFYIEQYDLRFVACDDDTDWDTYEFPDCDSEIYAEEGRVVSVGCYDELIYEGVDLFGMTFDELVSLLGGPEEIGEAIGSRTPLEFERYGMQVWLSEEGMVDSVMCSRNAEVD